MFLSPLRLSCTPQSSNNPMCKGESNVINVFILYELHRTLQGYKTYWAKTISGVILKGS